MYEKAGGKYDAIVLGTGLAECIVGGLLSVSGKRVLQIDANDYYGGESASLNITQIFKKFLEKEPSTSDFGILGQDYQYCIDQVPKFLMATGELIKILIHTKVTNYVQFRQIDGSFVYRGSTKKPYKVPATASEALRTGLMGIFQKRRLRNFLVFVKDCSAEDLAEKTGRDIITEYKLDANTASFVGHAMALCSDDSYLDAPASSLIEKLRLYAHSLNQRGKSPYLYPMYGLGSLPEGFARLSAVYGEAIGGALMLDQPTPEVLFDSTGRAVGIKSGDRAATATVIMGQPHYFPKAKTKVVGKVARAICLLDHPIPYTESVGHSGMVVLPAEQVSKGYAKRKNDIYVTCVDSQFEVCAERKYVAFVSTIMETDDPEKELKPGLDVLGKIMKKFVETSEVRVPTNDASHDNCHVSASLDSTTHFQTVAKDVLRLYKNITGNDLDMSIDATSSIRTEA
eukprot:g4430.t1